VCNLSVKNSITVDLKVFDERTSVLTAIVKYLNDCRIFQDILECFGELPKLYEVKDKAMVVNPNLKQNYGVLGLTYMRARLLYLEMPSQSTPITGSSI
jgi:hypothetical protein